jgi:hypothetical protein
MGVLSDAQPCSPHPHPDGADGLGLAVGEAHRRYTNFINARGRWTGHLSVRIRGHGRGTLDGSGLFM